MKADVIELLEDLEILLSSFNGCTPDINVLFEFVESKRSEYADPKGECCSQVDKFKI